MQASVMETPYFRPALPRRHLLRAFVDVALDHDAHDGFLAASHLLGESVCHLGLVLVVLLAVAVAAVDHQTGLETLLLQIALGFRDRLRVVVGTLLAAAEDDEAILVASCADNGDVARLRHRQEVVGMLDRAYRVNSDIQGPVGAVLEANREGETRGKLA